MKTLERYTVSEEIANGVSHLAAAVLSVIGTYFLVRIALEKSSVLYLVSALVYGLSMILLFVFSGLLHLLPAGKAKNVLSYFDQFSIFLMIAGTYTPFALLALKGRASWIVLAVEWILAVFGIVLKAFDKEEIEGSSKSIFIVIYLIMGWAFVIAWRQFYLALGMDGLLMVLAAGLLYTSGIIFYRWHSLKFHHLIWHLFVVAAAAIFYYVILTKVFLV